MAFNPSLPEDRTHTPALSNVGTGWRLMDFKPNRGPTLVALMATDSDIKTPAAIASDLDDLRDMVPPAWAGPRQKLDAASQCIRALQSRITELEETSVDAAVADD